ncbi:MAG: inositol monophosphatase family protein [Clostridia bacterium]|nr:inositol monophosphatase family protein [Clostridia bacterium]
MDYSGFLNFASNLAMEAGAFLKRFRGEGHLDIQAKVAGLDFVTNADKTAQKMIFESIAATYPDHGFIGEEDGLGNDGARALLRDGAERLFWVVDPLDGTLNYIRGLNGYSVSIALVRGTKPVVGVVYAPVEDELYSACEGGGAFKNGMPISASDCRDIHNALIIPSVPLTDMDLRDKMLAINSRLSRITLNTRIFGSAAVEISHVAHAGVDAYFEYGIYPWDVAAGVIIAREAGAIASSLDGREYELGDPGILVSAEGIHMAMVEAIGFDGK